jgi:hypothetical protein
MKRADEMVAATMHRDLAGAISSDRKLNEGFPFDLEKFQTVSDRKKPEVRWSAFRRFVRFLVTICIGVIGTLAWQSYGDATKQIIAARAPELGWSPESKQIIVSSIQWLGWMTTSRGPETTAAETVAPKAPIAPSLDSAQAQQMVQNLAMLREMVQELTAGQEQTTREIAKLESAVVEILMKIPEPQPQPPAASAHKPAPAPPLSSRPAVPPKQ